MACVFQLLVLDKPSERHGPTQSARGRLCMNEGDFNFFSPIERRNCRAAISSGNPNSMVSVLHKPIVRPKRFKVTFMAFRQALASSMVGLMMTVGFQIALNPLSTEPKRKVSKTITDSLFSKDHCDSIRPRQSVQMLQQQVEVVFDGRLKTVRWTTEGLFRISNQTYQTNPILYKSKNDISLIAQKHAQRKPKC